MRITVPLCVVTLGLLFNSAHALDRIMIEKFDGAERPQNWAVNFGHWEPKDGVLVARELEQDKHAAASRWQVPFADGVVKLKLRFAGAKGFHVGFDPAPGTLDKQGHLYSLIVTPTQARINKHKDKAKPDSKDEALATAGFSSVEGKWLDLELRTVGDNVRATLSEGTTVLAELEASDATFHVSKPAVVFRAMGGDIQLDDVEVTVTKPADPPQPKAKVKQ